MCFLIDSYELYQVRVKKIRKMPRWRFIARYFSKIGLKLGKFHIFWKKARISKKVRNVFLELGWSLRHEIWTVGTSCKNLGMLRGIFENFEF